MNKYDKHYNVFPSFDKKKGLELFDIVSKLEIDNLLHYAFMNDIPLNTTNDKKENLIHEILNIEKVSEISKLNAIKSLVFNKINPDLANKENITPLHLACKYQYENIVEYLISECNVNINSIDIMGSTPLHYLMKGKQELIEINNNKNFIEYNKSPSIRINETINSLKKDFIKEIINNNNIPLLQTFCNTIYYILEDDI